MNETQPAGSRGVRAFSTDSQHLGQMRHTLLHVAVLVAGGWLSTASAQVTEIDNWSTQHDVSVTDTAPPASAEEVVDGAGIAGDERDVVVVKIDGDTTTDLASTASSSRILGHSAATTVDGNSIVVWDGNDGIADNDNNDDNINDPTTLATPNFTGLGGISLNAVDCPSTDRGISFVVSDPNVGNVDFTVDIFTDGANWSSATKTKANSGGRGILFFRQSDFTAQAGSGANFSNVGAIRVEIDPSGPDEDINITSPIFTCGFDLGDATASTSFGFSSLSVDSRVEGALPDGTPGTGGPRHAISGPRIGGSVDADVTSQIPVARGGSVGVSGGGFAVFDDSDDGSDDEDGVTFPVSGASGFDALDTFPVTVDVQNVGATTPTLCGWIDFSDIDQQAGFGFENDAEERVCVAVADPNPGAAGDVCDDTATTGRFSCTLNFTIPGDWNGDNGDPGGTDNAFLSRFRVTTTWTGPSDAAINFNGFAADGEVEDYLITAGTLPVTIHSFSTRQATNALVIEWGTASETRNAGFAIWGDRGNGLELLTPELIPSTVDDAVRPQRYEYRLTGARAEDLQTLFVSAVELSGKERIYGAFEPSVRYGRELDAAPIPWRKINVQAQSRLAELQTVRANAQTAMAGAPVEAVDVTATGRGMHVVTFRQLADAGLDLSGIDPGRIAVTLKGEPVARQIFGGATFGASSSIRFWAEPPTQPDALYVEQYSYRIAENPEQVVEAVSLLGEFTGFVSSFEPPPAPREPDVYRAQQVEADNLKYHLANPSPDPWYLARLRADQVNAHTVEFSLDAASLPDGNSSLQVGVAGLTDFPESPDHRITIEVNGQAVSSHDFNGDTVQSLELDLPPGLLQVGVNSVRVVAPGGTRAAFDISLLDSVELRYARRMIAQDGRLLVFDHAPDPSADLVASGFGADTVLGYAREGERLFALGIEAHGADGVRIDSLERPADYWISTSSALLPVADVRGVPGGDLLAGADGNFVIIASPEFLPATPDEAHPLNDYLAARRGQGWRPMVFSVADIQSRYGWGMPLPQAVTRFLASADAGFDYQHVLLVGSDSYDYLDRLGLGSRSFIPTLYRSSRFITHGPADPLLADLDGDGVADKALGRWPVRTQADLMSIVTKTLDWSADPAALANAVWVTDSQDPNQASFTAQAGQLSESLVMAGWLGSEIAGVYFDEVVPVDGLSTADTAREQFFSRLEQGRSVSGFVGHGSPSAWTFQGLLSPSDIGDLFNEGNPTLIGTMTCYTTYFVSPYNDTVAHRWMNGYREDAQGNPIPGVPNGAVAVHGASVLSSYDTNGWFANSVLKHQLEGQTLGQSIEATRRSLAPGADQISNWILLGDPTLRLD